MRIWVYILLVSTLFVSCSGKIDLSDYEGTYVDVSSKRRDTVTFELLENGTLHFTNYKGQKFVFTYNESIQAIESDLPGFGLYRMRLDETGNLLKLVNEDKIIGVRADFYEDYREKQETTINGLLNEVEPKS
ncbi:MAG: hypothetical protein AAGA43_15655 [Bacteroidota bacterium]